LAFTSILQQLFITLINYTGGDNGLYGFPFPELQLPGGLTLLLENEYISYYFILISLIVFYLISKAIVNSSFGLVMKGIKDNEGRMEFFGYSVAFCKLVVFVISAGMAGFCWCAFVPVSFRFSFDFQPFYFPHKFSSGLRLEAGEPSLVGRGSVFVKLSGGYPQQFFRRYLGCS